MLFIIIEVVIFEAMKKFLLLLFIGMIAIRQQASAQFETIKDSVVQLYGVIMTADSLRPIPAVSVMVKGRVQGTMSSEDGVFSIVVLKGDEIEFTSIGFKPVTVKIRRDLVGNQHSVIQLMVTDTTYLPATIIRPRPTREQFERDFVNTDVKADALEIARQNTDEQKREALARTMPRDGGENANYSLKQDATKRYYSGQVPPMNIFNPMAWGEFIKAWKRGDFRNKN